MTFEGEKSLNFEVVLVNFASLEPFMSLSCIACDTCLGLCV